MLDGKICLVTGSTSGIGKEIAVGLASRGGSVVLVGRDGATCERVAAEIGERSGGSSPAGFLIADLSSQASIRNAAKEFKDRYSRLDVLVNNAGVFRAHKETTVDGIEYTFAVNHLAPFLITNLLMDRIKVAGPARVVTTSSITHRGARMEFGDLQFANRRYNGIKAYGQSKLANILFTKELARRLEGTGVRVNCFHPGGVRTGLARGNPWYYKVIWRIISPFLIGTEKGADTGIYLATSEEIDSISGRYFVKRKQVIPSAEAQNTASASRLWEVSEALTGTSSV